MTANDRPLLIQASDLYRDDGVVYDEIPADGAFREHREKLYHIKIEDSNVDALYDKDIFKYEIYYKILKGRDVTHCETIVLNLNDGTADLKSSS